MPAENNLKIDTQVAIQRYCIEALAVCSFRPKQYFGHVLERNVCDPPDPTKTRGQIPAELLYVGQRSCNTTRSKGNQYGPYVKFPT